MTKYIIILLLILFPLNVVSQVSMNKTTLCTDGVSIQRTLTNREFQEKPIWMGITENNAIISVYYNKENTRWTVVEFIGRIGCILGAGEESQLSTEYSTKK